MGGWQGFFNVLEWMGEFVRYLKPVCKLCTKKFTKRRLIATCFQERPASLHTASIEAFHAVVYEGRWGSILHCAQSLLEVETPLRMHFDTRAYTFAKPYKAPAEDDDHQINVELVAEAISNAKFWGYCTMIATLGKFLMYVMRWAEGCPCHREGFSFVDPLPSRLERRRKLLISSGERRCPLSGRNGPYCAAGELQDPRAFGRKQDFLKRLLN